MQTKSNSSSLDVDCMTELLLSPKKTFKLQQIIFLELFSQLMLVTISSYNLKRHLSRFSIKLFVFSILRDRASQSAVILVFQNHPLDVNYRILEPVLVITEVRRKC
jgi:hypothetical protein